MKVSIVKMESPKCPRCYDRNGVKENYQGMCDRCCSICLNAAEDFVTFKMLTQDESDLLVSNIKKHYKSQLGKYGLGSVNV